MFGIILCVVVTIIMAAAIVWTCEQISSYMSNENLQPEEYFEYEPLFK